MNGSYDGPLIFNLNISQSHKLSSLWYDNLLPAAIFATQRRIRYTTASNGNGNLAGCAYHCILKLIYVVGFGELKVRTKSRSRTQYENKLTRKTLFECSTPDIFQLLIEKKSDQ